MNSVNLMVAGLVGSAPMLLVLALGLILSLHHYSRIPRACLLTGAGIGILLAARLILPPLMSYLMTHFMQGGGNPNEVSVRILVQGLVTSIPSAVGLALILWAVFGQPDSRMGRGELPPDMMPQRN